MLHLISRRGPDDEGQWNDGNHCWLGFRRLSILDLSPTGHQPMQTIDGRYVIVMNGEIYNFRELRGELEGRGVRFRSTGDTEVVLYALAKWGVGALDRFNGMFALAFYDTHEKRLLLARDHAGIKPLYYLQTDQGVVFGSQYNQLLVHPWGSGLQVDQSALRMYLGLSYIPAPNALFQQTYNLQAGHWVEFDAFGSQKSGCYFTFPKNPGVTMRGQVAWEAVDAAVSNAVRRQLVSDVPLGTFLSGGIDSPLVTAKAFQAGNHSIKAFTIAAEDDRFDESADAKQYAQELGVQQIVERVTEQQAYQMVADVISATIEPFGDYSIIPTMIISRQARQQVTVMLSGDGGDELFWGYAGRFASVLRKTRDFSTPPWVRSARWGLEKMLNLGQENYNPYFFPNIGEWYRSKHLHLYDPHVAAAFPDLPGYPVNSKLFTYTGTDPDTTAQWMRWNEFTAHLSMVLQKVDRASMYHSLEVRVPLLDREVIEVALQIDWRDCLDIHQAVGKIPLRKSLARHVKHQSLQKRGFSVPMDAWLRGPLRSMFEDEVLARRDVLGIPFNAGAVRVLFDLHLSGQADFSWGLWSILSLFLWEKQHVRNLRHIHP